MLDIPMTERQRAVLVLGAGRSGTSTLTRALQALGVYLGRRFRRPVRKNPRGNYEELNLLRLSKAIRRLVGLRAESVRLLDDGVWQNPELQAYRERVSEVIRREFGDHPIWAFKYGGTGRLLPFWLDLLPRLGIQPMFAFAYRNPMSIARSRSRLDRLRGRPEKNHLEWLAYVVPYFHLIRDYPMVVVDYDRLVAEPRDELRRLGRGLAIELDDAADAGIEAFAHEFVRPDWRHASFSDQDLLDDPAIHPLVKRAAVLLSRLSRDLIVRTDPEFEREWAQIRLEHAELAPILRLIDELQSDLRRARWWDLARPLRIGWNKMPLLRAR